MSNKHWEQNKDATVYVGNLDERFGEAMMWELMTQMGPVMNVHMPMDRVSRTHQGYGFVEFNTPESADYAARVLNGIRIFGKPIRVNKASADRQRGAADIGAELFVNNLDPQVDEKILYDTFSSFGTLVTAPTVIRDANNVSKGYGFVSFDSFDASDAARDTMNGQYLLSKQITVEYAYKKDGKGERHGDEAERKLAAEGKKHNIVPEAQPLPPAFLMSGPRPAPGVPAAAEAGAGPVPSHGPGLVAPNGPAAAKSPARFPEPNGPMPPGGIPAGVPAGFGAPAGVPAGVPAGLGGPPPRAAPPPFGGMPGGPGRGPNLPPPPSGLPARPPPSHVPYGRPAGDFRPGSAPPFRPGGPPGAPQHIVPGQPGGIPPPGFGAPPPPPGFGGPMGVPPPMVPGMPGVPPGVPGAPGGFMPPPGFGAPGSQPPAGYARR